MKRTLVAILLLVSILLGTVCMSSCDIDSNLVLGTIILEKGKSNILTLGDSIAAGTKLAGYDRNKSNGDAPADAFSTLFGANIGKTAANFAVEGYQTADVLNQLKTNSVVKTVATNYTGIITLTVGSNDIFVPTLERIKAHCGIDNEDYAVEDQMLLDYFAGLSLVSLIGEFKAISIDFESDEVTTMLQTAVDNFKPRFDEIIRLLKQYNPNGEIYVTTLYNPLAGLKSFDWMGITIGNTADIYINQINDYIVSRSGWGNYTVVDCSNLGETVKDENGVELKDENGKAYGYLNTVVDIAAGKYDLDPHPNKIGHAEIAKRITAAYLANHPSAEQ